MLVKHLDKSKLFKKVELKDVSDGLLENSSMLDDLAKEGVNWVIMGDITHFYGFQSSTGSENVAVLFGVIGVLTEAIANPKTVGGHITYSIKVIDVNKKEVVWQGEVDYSFKEKDKFYDGPVCYALRALKAANNKLTEKLESLSMRKGYLTKQEVTK